MGDGLPAVPPGFSSLTSFMLQRVEDDTKHLLTEKIDDQTIKKFKESLRHRPWVNYRKLDDCSDAEESSLYLPDQRLSTIDCLPKGVIRGCVECADCQKVVARWRREESRKLNLDKAPVFYPTEEEFKDSLNYIESIRPEAEKYGICRIVPPSSWKLPPLLKEKHMWINSKFVTRVQQIDKLQNRQPVKKFQQTCDVITTHKDKKRKKAENSVEVVERFGFIPGPEFNLESFQNYADYFKEEYFQTEEKTRKVSVEDIEGEYWRIVENPTEAIEVLYGADLDTASFGSGFPKESSDAKNAEYLDSGWNLNNMPKLAGSVLSFEDGNIPGVQVPWLYVGMCLSSFCWHVEDHHLYSLNYHHMGAPKVWYGVPQNDALKLEAAMKKHLPDLFEEQPDLLHNLVTQFSPSLLKQEGVSVYRCVQHEGEFVLTFPRAYHSGFNCGFNCAEAVNLAPIDWLPHGQSAVELYREQKRKITLSHDKLLLGAVNEAVRAHWGILLLRLNSPRNLWWKRFSGLDGLLTKTLRARIAVEQTRRKHLCVPARCRKIDAGFDVTERECVVCHFDLYLSAAACSSLTCMNKFACLMHAKELCACNWSTRYFLFRYDDAELSLLIDALGGKMSAVLKWGLSCLGLSLSSSLSTIKAAKDKSSEPFLLVNSISREGSASLVVSSEQRSTISTDESDKVGGRTSYVEILEYGVVLPGKLWSTSHAIFPKGFMSRVKYWSYVEPNKMCDYICKILDAGLEGPLFLVSVEESPNELFVHAGPQRCWEMVRERVIEENEKIYELMQKSGIVPKSSNLLLRPGPIDGFEMFGLSSPQLIQALGEHRNSPVSRENGPTPTHRLLEGFFKKGSLEELHAFQTVFGASKLLSEEIKSRHC